MAREEAIYIAGPMTGYPEWNYPAFHRAAAWWRSGGWKVLNPAESFGGRTDLPYTRYMRSAVRLVLKATAIALLPGWQNSPGAQMELLIALRQGYDVFDAITGEQINPAPMLRVITLP